MAVEALENRDHDKNPLLYSQQQKKKTISVQPSVNMVQNILCQMMVVHLTLSSRQQGNNHIDYKPLES